MVELFRLQEGWPLVFTCDRMRATLSPAACADGFKNARNLSCARCPTGASHVAVASAPAARPADLQHQSEAGRPYNHRERHGYFLPFRRPGGQVCIRCQAQVLRRIGPGLCVSCLNRQAELQRGKNGKGTFPGHTAARLYKCHALLVGEFPRLSNVVLRTRSQCSPAVQRLTGGAFVTGVFSSRAEFDRWLSEHYPDAESLDFELGRSFLELTAQT